MAHVRLLFKGTGGARMVASRRMQLTVKKTTRSVKSLESSLNETNRNGEKQVISSKVGEMDSMLIESLGVSKAVLDDVIFCHQDESLWPMREPADLKKRFDAIFEAQKYTKAIDNIKVLRKQRQTDLGQLKIHEENAKTEKIRGEKVRFISPCSVAHTDKILGRKEDSRIDQGR